VKKLAFLLFFFLTIFSNCIFSAEFEKEYLKKIELEKQDTSIINLYIELSKKIYSTSPQNALNYLLKAEVLAKKKQFRLLVVYDNIAHNYLNLSNYKKSLDYCFLILSELKQQGNKRTLTQEKSNYFKSTTFEKLASIYSELGNIKLALKYQKEAIEILRKNYQQSVENQIDFHMTQINLANFYLKNNELNKAINTYLMAESNFIRLNNFDYLSYIYNGLASCYSQLNEHQKALHFYEKSKETVLKHTPNNLSSLAVALNNIASKQETLGNNIAAIINYSEALELFKKLDDKSSIAISYYNLGMIFRNVKQFEKSNDYMLRYVELTDTLFNEDTKQIIHDLSIKYESEKKEQENKLLAKENEKKQLSIYFALSGILLVLIILFIIFRNSQIKSRINRELEQKNTIIEEQKMLVEEQHKEITDSIKYAERIQGAILPPDQKWQQILPNSFVLNKPKDILSGDFYWIAETESQIFVAAADCTGHGVPGALISIVNFNLLNKAVLEKGLTLPSEILDAVNLWLTESLNQTIEESSIKDGMDISLISIDKKTKQVLFSGANNPLYLFTNNELNEIKGDKFPVGAFINEQIQHFTTKEIPTKFGDTIYLFSDGFADQFGGEFGKKYKYKQLKEKLFIAKERPIHKQKEFLAQEFRTWKGKYEQTDDVLIIGINF
jgi:serine phosphatase RsbU (regulator of sigma subunit)